MWFFETTIRHKQIDSPFDERKRQAREVLDLAKEYFKNDKPRHDHVMQLKQMLLDQMDHMKTLVEKQVI